MRNECKKTIGCLSLIMGESMRRMCALCFFLLSFSFFTGGDRLLQGQAMPQPNFPFPELPGFPFLIPDEQAGTSGVNVGDIDGDGDLEICFGTGGGNTAVSSVYILHHTGTIADGWPVTGQENVQYATPSLVDLDLDGDLEVFFTDSSYLYAYQHDASPIEGWPVLLTDSVHMAQSESTPAIGDIDGDGDIEIVHGSVMRPCLVFAWHHDGTPVAGWPVMLPPGDLSHCDLLDRAPTLSDLDGDGTLETIIATRGAQVYVLKSDGTNFPGWPKWNLEPMSYCAVSVGDIDGDGEPDIVVGSDYQTIYAWDRFGNSKPGWPWEASDAWETNGIVLADLLGDGALEVIANFSSPFTQNLFVFDGRTASVLPGWPKPDDMEARCLHPTVVSDIDEDGEREIVMAGYDGCGGGGCLGYVLAYDADGTMVSGFPISLGYQATNTSPCIVDLDQDGDLEICHVTDYGYFFFGDCYLHVWDLPSPYVKTQGDWPFLYQSPYHTSNYGFLLPTEHPIDVDLSPDTVTVRRGESFGLSATFTNLNVVYQWFDTGLLVRLPNGELYGKRPLYGPYSLRLANESESSFERQVAVPSNAPLGDYRLLLPAGSSVHNIMDFDSTIVQVVE